MLRRLWLDIVWVVALAALSSAWILSTNSRLSATFDEPIYFKLGLDHWRSGNGVNLKRVGTMPLPVDVVTLPAYLHERVTGEIVDDQRDFGKWLPWQRAMTLPFWWLLLGHGWWAARQLGGPIAGRLAVAVLALEPTFLGHAGLGTTDLACAATLLTLGCHYRSGAGAHWFRRLIVPMFASALCYLSKASAVAYVPLILGSIEIERFVRERRFSVARPLSMIIVGFLLASVYCGTTEGHARNNLLKAVSVIPWAGLRELMSKVASKVPLYVHAWDSVMFQIRHNHDGHGGTFLLGKFSEKPVWYYFPAAFLIKTSIPVIALMILSLRRPRQLGTWPIAVAAIMLLISLTCRVQIGVRYLMPMMTLLIVGVSAAIARSDIALTIPAWRYAGRAFVGLALMAGAVDVGRAWPDGVRYSNGIFADSEVGYTLLGDSNYDWGQGLIDLEQWKQRRRIDSLDVVYFGTDPRLQEMGFRWVDLKLLTPDDLAGGGDKIHSRFLAVSTTVLYSHPNGRNDAGELLRNTRPIAKTSTFLIFDRSEIALARR